MAVQRLTGHEAISFAEDYGLLLCKYTDPQEAALSNISTEHARETAQEDPSLVYLDTEDDM
jgi:hypothetical protein